MNAIGAVGVPKSLLEAEDQPVNYDLGGVAEVDCDLVWVAARGADRVHQAFSIGWISPGQRRRERQRRFIWSSCGDHRPVALTWLAQRPGYNHDEIRTLGLVPGVVAEGFLAVGGSNRRGERVRLRHSRPQARGHAGVQGAEPARCGGGGAGGAGSARGAGEANRLTDDARSRSSWTPDDLRRGDQGL
jgi:hypothetical protein